MHSMQAHNVTTSQLQQDLQDLASCSLFGKLYMYCGIFHEYLILFWGKQAHKVWKLSENAQMIF